MKILLHIGWHKTGTTAIQRLLFDNRRFLRERLAIDYPDTGLRAIGHAPLAWSLQPGRDGAEGRDPGELFAALKAEVAARGLERCIISSEAFSTLRAPRVKKLAQLLQGHEVEVIAYVRRQDRYLESRYNQSVKFSQVRLALDFTQFVAQQLEASWLDYQRYFGTWAAVFGREALRVRMYERADFPQGDVRRDFCDVAGVPIDGLAFEQGASNESLDYQSVCFLRTLNAVPMSAEMHERVVQELRRLNKDQDTRRVGFFTPAERVALLARFRESNRSFAREFFGREDLFDLRVEELEEDAGRDLAYGEEQFFSTFAAILPAMLGAPRAAQAAGRPGAPRRKRKAAA